MPNNPRTTDYFYHVAVVPVATSKVTYFIAVGLLFIVALQFSGYCYAMLCKRGLSRHAVSVRPSVRPSISYPQFVHSVKMSNRIFNFFSLSAIQTILGFQYQTSWQYSNGNPRNGSVECRCGRPKSRF